VDEPSALATVLVEIGLDSLVGGLPAFVNVPPALLHSDALRLLPPANVVLELLEHNRATDETLRSIQELKAMGYRLAFDDFTFDECQLPFLDHVHIVKIDLLGVSMDELARKMKVFQGRKLTLLAEKIDTEEQAAACVRMGFDLFQGHFLSRPSTMSKRAASLNRLALAQLMVRLLDPDASIEEIENLVGSDVTFTYRLLKLINSAAVGVACKVESIRQALMFLGVARVRALAGLLVMTTIGDKPQELFVNAMVRARMCERLSRQWSLKDPEQYFTLGLLSVLDALMDMPMEDVLRELPISDALRAALCGAESESEMARVLQCATGYERGDWDAVESAAGDEPGSCEAYKEAVEWSAAIAQPMAA
jgi:EAL and modified HD-GYP domain-containing signal transduction protein